MCKGSSWIQAGMIKEDGCQYFVYVIMVWYWRSSGEYQFISTWYLLYHISETTQSTVKQIQQSGTWISVNSVVASSVASFSAVFWTSPFCRFGSALWCFVWSAKDWLWVKRDFTSQQGTFSICPDKFYQPSQCLHDTMVWGLYIFRMDSVTFWLLSYWWAWEHDGNNSIVT